MCVCAPFFVTQQEFSYASSLSLVLLSCPLRVGVENPLLDMPGRERERGVEREEEGEQC